LEALGYNQNSLLHLFQLSLTRPQRQAATSGSLEGNLMSTAHLTLSRCATAFPLQIRIIILWSPAP